MNTGHPLQTALPPPPFAMFPPLSERPWEVAHPDFRAPHPLERRRRGGSPDSEPLKAATPRRLKETEGEQNGERKALQFLGNPRDILLHPKPSL